MTLDYSLIWKAQNGCASEEELDNIRLWREFSVQNESTYQTLTSRTSKNITVNEKTKRKNKERILARYHQKRKKTRTIRNKRWVAAACILLLVGIGTHSILYKNTVSVEISKVTQPILILDNGEQKILSATDTSMFVQGNVTVEKTGQRLVYEKKEKSLRVRKNTLLVPAGQTFYLTLADDTEVWLNAGSKLTYPTSFTGKKREVTVVGEAYFHVSKSDVPFIVNSGRHQIHVKGTEFNVSSYRDSETIETVLIEGSVLIRSQIDNQLQLLLTPGNKCIYQKASGEAEQMEADTAVATAWREGMYLFRGETCEKILHHLKHWYDYEILFESDEARNICLNGSILLKKDLNHLVKLLSSFEGISIQKENNTLIVK